MMSHHPALELCSLPLRHPPAHLCMAFHLRTSRPPSIPVPIYGLDLRGGLPSSKAQFQLKNGRQKSIADLRAREGGRKGVYQWHFLERLRDLHKFKIWRQKRTLSEQFLAICAQTSWSRTLKKFMYHLLSMAQLISEFQHCRSKALAVVRGIRSKLATILYIY